MYTALNSCLLTLPYAAFCLWQILRQKTPFDEEPLYLYLSHQAVHSPLGLPPEESFSEEQKAILEEIRFSSDSMGHLRERFAKVKLQYSWYPEPPFRKTKDENKLKEQRILTSVEKRCMLPILFPLFFCKKWIKNTTPDEKLFCIVLMYVNTYPPPPKKKCNIPKVHGTVQLLPNATVVVLHESVS